MTYKIGQILTSKEDVVVEMALSEEKVIIPKGNEVIIGADNLAHHLRDGSIQPLAKSDSVEGYDAEGLAKYLIRVLKSHFPIDDMFEDYDIDIDNLQKEIEYALDDIGL